MMNRLKETNMKIYIDNKLSIKNELYTAFLAFSEWFDSVRCRNLTEL